MKIYRLILLCFVVINFSDVFAGPITVIDDENRQVTILSEAKRVISLSPHATELLFAAGATDQVIATVSYSDYPEQAKKIQRIGSNQKLDFESIITLKPDLIIAWKSGVSDDQLKHLKQLGLTLFYSEPKLFDDVAKNIINFGKLLGTGDIAEIKARQFLISLKQLQEKYQNRSVVDVFYQVWNQPLMTINGDHMINSVIEFCGGRNIFKNLAIRAPRVNIESVLVKNPDAIIIGISQGREDWVYEWSKWKDLKAVKNNHVFTVDADYIVRQGTRVLKGIASVCDSLESVRKHNRK